MRRSLLRASLLALVVLAISTPPLEARIKLITLPVRERVEIQLDHGHATLVEEERIVPLVKGVNQVDFSWANTLIDAETIVFRVVGPGDGAADVRVLSVSYPPGENALVWQVASNDSGSARVRISYVLGNLNKSFNYRAVASRDEKTLTLWQYIRLQNLSNEAFGETGVWAGFGPRFLKPIGINETKELLVEKYQRVPVKKTYSVNAAAFGWLDQPQQKLLVPMHYVLKNDKKNQLGLAAMPRGKVRIFQEDGRGSNVFLGEDWGAFTPLDDEMKLYLGVAQDVVVKRTFDRSQRTRVAGNLFNHEVVVKYEIENFKDSPIVLDIAETLAHLRNEVVGGQKREVQWEIGGETTLGELDGERTTQQEAVFHVELPPRDKDGKAEKITHKLHIVFRNEW